MRQDWKVDLKENCVLVLICEFHPLILSLHRLGYKGQASENCPKGNCQAKDVCIFAKIFEEKGQYISMFTTAIHAES